MKPLRPIALLVVGAALVAGMLVPATPAAGALAVSVEMSGTLKTGVTFTRYLLTPGPVRVNVVTVDLAKASTTASPSTIDVTVGSRGRVGGQSKTSAYAIATKALAAINGDFGGAVSPRRPEHPYVQNGELWTSGTAPANNVGVSVPAPYATNPPMGYAERTVLHVTATSGQVPLDVTSWNAEQPVLDDIVGFTARGAGTAVPNPVNCNVRLGGPSALATTWANARNGIVDTYTVKESLRCAQSSYAIPSGRDVVLSALNGSAGAGALGALLPGDTVRIRWALGLPGVLDSLGGRPELIEAGQRAGTGTGGTFVCDLSIKDNLCKAQPRSLVSMTKECSDGVTGCKVSLVEVDGRSSSWSVGLKLDDLATFLLTTLNSYSAMNLDGGGSATMYVQQTGPWCLTMLTTGCLVSSLANNNGTERAVTNAVVLLPWIDPKEPHPSGG